MTWFVKMRTHEGSKEPGICVPCTFQKPSVPNQNPGKVEVRHGERGCGSSRGLRCMYPYIRTPYVHAEWYTHASTTIHIYAEKNVATLYHVRTVYVQVHVTHRQLRTYIYIYICIRVCAHKCMCRYRYII